MVIYGSRLYGKVDAVPGLGHVATRFIHINFVPLMPTASYLILASEGKTFRGVPVPLSFKSIAMTWLRIGAAVAGGVGLIGLAVTTADGHVGTAIAIAALTIPAWALFIFSLKHRVATRASYRRACELGKLMKLTDAGMQKIADSYGEAPISYGFQPLPIATAPPMLQADLVEPMLQADLVEPMLETDPVEVIPVDGADWDSSVSTAADGPTASAVQPIRPRAGY